MPSQGRFISALTASTALAGALGLWLGLPSEGFAQASSTPSAPTTVAANGAVAAQPATPAGAAAADQAATPTVGAVIVHARKRSEAAVEVPVAITALNPQALKNQNITQLEDLSRAAPNVIIQRSSDVAGTILAEIRGQIAEATNIAVDSPVGYYMDGVYIAESKGLATGLFDLQDVEISRGVQGTLNGRNNTGGSISFFTTKPDLHRYSVEASGTVGERDYLGGHLIVNIPVSDTFALRFGYQQIHQNGQGRSITTGEPFQGIGQQVWRISALWTPTPKFSLSVIYDGTRLYEPPNGFRELPGTLIVGALESGTRSALNPSGAMYPASAIFPANFWDNSLNFTQLDWADTNFLRTTASYEVNNDLTAKVTAGWRYMRASAGYDVDGSPVPFLQATNFGGYSRQFTIEPQLLGSGFDSRLHWVLGYFHFEDRGSYVSTTYAESINARNPSTPFVNQLLINDDGYNISDAGYIHGEYAITPAWKIAVGYRYTNDQREIFPHSVTNFAYPLGAAYGAYQAGFLPAQQCRTTTARGPCPPFELQKTFGYGSYEVSTHYDINSHLHAYFRTGKGQKSGGFNVPVNTQKDAPFAPEQLTDYEVGLKTNALLDGRLDANIDYFYGNYKNMQRLISTILPGGGGVATQVINAGRATIQGVEADANWRPVDNLTLTGYLGYTDAKYNQFTSTNGVTVFNLVNQPFFATPKWTGRIGATYLIPMSTGDVRLSGGWSYQSSESLLVISFPSAFQRGYGLFDGRISWTAPKGDWEVALWGTNLADQHYYVAAQGSRSSPDPASTPSYGVLVPGDRRTVALTVTYKFGS